jgi:hypothetical protein
VVKVVPGSVRDFLLTSIGMSAQELSDLRVVHTARILPGRSGEPPRVAFGFLGPSAEGQLIVGPTPAYAMALVKVDEAWRIWGPPSHEDFGSSELVRLPVEAPIREETLSVLASEWIIALEPHLDALLGLESSAASEEDVFVHARETAHSVALITMLVFAIESLGARLVASGRLDGQLPGVFLDRISDVDRRQELTELFVVRNVLTHNHIWRVAFTADADWSSFTLDATDHVHGDIGRRLYITAVPPGKRETLRLHLAVVPTSVRRIDAYRVLPAAVWAFDELAALDVANMRSLADHPIRAQGRVRRLREWSGSVGLPPSSGS